MKAKGACWRSSGDRSASCREKGRRRSRGSQARGGAHLRSSRGGSGARYCDAALLAPRPMEAKAICGALPSLRARAVSRARASVQLGARPRSEELSGADPALCELANAHLKSHHGTALVLVRGLEKVTCVALLAALANNILAHATSWLG